MRPGSSVRAASTVWLALWAGALLSVTSAGSLHAQQAISTVPSSPPAGAAESPVTVVATHYVKAGCRATFETLINQTFERSRAIAGDPSASIVRPSQPGSNTYTVIVKFDRTSDYQRWLGSPERAAFNDELGQLVVGSPQAQLRSGMEIWVTPPEQASSDSPDLYKTLAVNFLALYPTYMVSSVVLAPVLTGYPLYVTAAARSGLSLTLAGLGVVQIVARTFQGWLFPPPELCRAG